MTISCEQKLYAYEWLAVVCIIGFLGMMTTIVFLNQENETFETLDAPSFCIQKQEICVTIKGSVQNPGTYSLKKGSVLGEVVALAKPTEEADLRKLNLKAKLRKGQVLNIPSIEMIEVKIEGFIESPALIKVPKGTCLKDLINYLKLYPETDLKPLQKKRKLKDQETVILKQRKKR